jgi:AcrR family transcriptional regulator
MMGASEPGGPPGQPKRADARRNYERLLAAATAAFAEHGADDVSLEEIARRAGVGIGTLYRHFPARQALVETVFTEQVDALDALAAKLRTAETPGAALGEWLRAFVAFGRTKRSLIATVGKDSAFMSQCSTILRSRTAELLRRAQDAGEAQQGVQPADILRLTHGLIVASDAAPADLDQQERMLSLIIAGLLTGSRD